LSEDRDHIFTGVKCREKPSSTASSNELT